jgi:hypothetical protein
MNDDELARALNETSDLVPSSGFTDSVMDAIRHESATLPPLAFPWRRAWPALASLVIAFAAAVALALSTSSNTTTVPPAMSSPGIEFPTVALPNLSAPAETAALMAASLVLALLCFRLSMRLTGNSSR